MVWHDIYYLECKYSCVRRLFIVDDDHDILLSLKIWFSKKGFDVRVFQHSRPLFDALYQSMPDLILLDVNLNGEDGREICKRIKNEFVVNRPVILFSANAHALENYKDSCADGVLHKPFSLHEIYSLINSYVPAEVC